MALLRSPEGCPWDREQTFESIKRHTLEETYEVFDAIDRQAWPELKDELGDLLLQVLFYAQMAEEAGHFTIEEVAENLNAKLVRRHPHIFGDAVAATPEAVKQVWDAVKGREKAAQGVAKQGLLDDVSRHQPALLEAAKLGRRAAEVGFDWPDAAGLMAKLAEETGEISQELASERLDRGALEEELGDLLFTAVNLSRHLKLEPEFALRVSNAKFRRRFEAMERAAGGAGALAEMIPDALEELWKSAKASLAQATGAGAYRAAGGSLPDSSSDG